MPELSPRPPAKIGKRGVDVRLALHMFGAWVQGMVHRRTDAGVDSLKPNDRLGDLQQIGQNSLLKRMLRLSPRSSELSHCKQPTFMYSTLLFQGR